MVRDVSSFRRLALMVLLLALTGLACNFQSGSSTEEAAPPTATSTATSTRAQSAKEAADDPTLSPPETLPAGVPTEALAPTVTVPPTFTPIEAPTLAVTRTPTGTSTRRPLATSTPGSAQPPGDSTGPLSMQYNVSWRLKDAAAQQAIATVTLTATGGGGGYKYYKDIEEMDGHTFEYEWSVCRPNPVTFRVTSASGESAEEVLFLHPPCPTPTPTP